jgi:integrase/recombinase XerD
MHLLRSGNDINMISYWLGHTDINTTHVYLEIDMEMKRKMIEKAGAPAIQNRAPWHSPEILEWLKELGRSPELCAVNRGQMKKNQRMGRVNFT